MILIKKEHITLIAISILAIPLFWISNVMTPNPGQSSGNGNPAILFMGIICILFCSLVYLWVRTFNNYRHRLNSVTGIICIFLLTFHLFISSLYQRHSFIHYKNVLADAYKERFGTVDWVYIDQITSFMSIHVNNQYFNVNTYFMFLAFSILTAILIVYLQKLFVNK